MSQINDNCPCCGNVCNSQRDGQHSRNYYECEECGTFAISDLADCSSIRRRSLMYYYLLHKRPSEKPVVFVQDIKSFIDKTDAHYIDVQTLENLNPRTLNDKIDMILLNLSKKIKTLGDSFDLSLGDEDPQYFPFFIVDDTTSKKSLWTQVDAVIKIMEEYNFLKREDLCFNEISCKLTAAGWNRLSELQQKSFLQGFIAMSFADKLKGARAKIQQAITDSGYLPVIIDEKEHNNQIMPEIFYEIERSAFVIADLTNQRNGVYYEAGYAQALSKEVIVTCKNNDFKNVHFDVSQKNMILWDDDEDLYKRLFRRINATVGNRK